MVPTVDIDGDKFPIFYMRCSCRTWPIMGMNTVGKCGKCGTIPGYEDGV